MSPRAPLFVQAQGSQKIICKDCKAVLDDKLHMIKHYRAIHGYSIQDAISKASDSAGPSGD